jgi:hypothetical protein
MAAPDDAGRLTGNPEGDRHEGSRWITSALPTIHEDYVDERKQGLQE